MRAQCMSKPRAEDYFYVVILINVDSITAFLIIIVFVCGLKMGSQYFRLIIPQMAYSPMLFIFSRSSRGNTI